MTADTLGGLLDLISDQTLSGRMAKDVFDAMLETGRSAASLVEEKGLRQVTDTGALLSVIDQILAAHADKVAEYKAGKDKLFGFFGNIATASVIFKRRLLSISVNNPFRIRVFN